RLAPRRRAVGCDDRLLDQLRAHRQPPCGECPGLAGVRIGGRLPAFHGHAASGSPPHAGHVPPQRRSGLQARRRRGPRVELECRTRLAEAASASRAMSMKTTVRMGLMVAISLGCAAAAAAPSTERPVVTIAQGTLAGRVDAQGIRSFKGIPYAEPPIGNKRWTAPVAAKGWKGLRDAGRFGASCIQPPWPAQSIYNDRISNVNEDCLFLNVWAPAHARQAPVIVWIYGGGLVF